MKKTYILLTLLAVALATGLLFVSCDTESKPESKSSGPDSALNGTWVNEGGGIVKFDNGNFQFESSDGTPMDKGTYTTSGSTLTMTITHVWGESCYVGGTEPVGGPEWYTKADLKATGFTDEDLNTIFVTRSITYSVSGNTLTFGDMILTKQQ